MTTRFSNTRAELEELIASLTDEEKQLFTDIPFAELPIESFTLGHIIDGLPKEIQSRFDLKIRKLKKLNALLRISEKKPEVVSEVIQQNALGVAIEENEKPIDVIYKIGNTLLEQFKFRTYSDTKEILRYDPELGYWTSDGAVFVERVLKANGLKLSKHQISEVTYHIQTSTYEERGNFVGAIDGDMLHVSNGWLNMDTLELQPHSHERLSIAKIPTVFDRKAGPVEFVKMVNTALPDPEFRLRLYKVMGNLLIQDSRYEKATLFVGEGHNRKGSIIFAIQATIGSENCCSVSLQEIAEDRFATADFYGKLANLVADLSAEGISNTGRFKELVSGDMIRAQKKHQPSFLMHNNAKLIYSTNKIPPSNDQTNAYMRRWEIIPFYRSFDRDPTLQERLRVDRERSGILNLMLWGRKILIEEGFEEVSIERVRYLYNQNASVAKDFLTEECVIDFNQEDFKTRTSVLQDAYVNYSIDKKHKKKSDREGLIRQLGEELSKQGVENRQRGTRAERERFYIGIKLKSEVRKEQQTLQ